MQASRDTSSPSAVASTISRDVRPVSVIFKSIQCDRLELSNTSTVAIIAHQLDGKRVLERHKATAEQCKHRMENTQHTASRETNHEEDLQSTVKSLLTSSKGMAIAGKVYTIGLNLVTLAKTEVNQNGYTLATARNIAHATSVETVDIIDEIRTMRDGEQNAMSQRMKKWMVSSLDVALSFLIYIIAIILYVVSIGLDGATSADVPFLDALKSVDDSLRDGPQD